MEGRDVISTLTRKTDEGNAMALASTEYEPQIAKGAAIGGLIGFVLVVLLYGGICLAVGYDQMGALGVAVFAGIWGGPGFGAMMGAVVAMHPPEER